MFQRVVAVLSNDFVVECFLFVFWLTPEMLSLHRKEEWREWCCLHICVYLTFYLFIFNGGGGVSFLSSIYFIVFLKIFAPASFYHLHFCLFVAGMWRCRYLVIAMATMSTCLRETAACSGVIRKSLRKHQQ